MRADRVVVDTNVFISAALWPAGRAGEALRVVREAGGVLLFSDETFAELTSRLMRPKFDRYAGADARRRFLAELESIGVRVTITGALRACRDPDDDKFLETAVNGGADCLVTGDGDLLALATFRNVRILTPARFVEAARGTGPG